MPPLYLGALIPWSPFDSLSFYLINHRTKPPSIATDCSRKANDPIYYLMLPDLPVPEFIDDDYVSNSTCDEYNSWTTLPWTFFFAFENIQQEYNIRFLNRDDMDVQWFGRL